MYDVHFTWILETLRVLYISANIQLREPGLKSLETCFMFTYNHHFGSFGIQGLNLGIKGLNLGIQLLNLGIQGLSL